MFHDNLTVISQKTRTRITCILCSTLLAASNLFAEDELAEYDPDRNFTILGWLRDLWHFLSGLMA